MPRRSPIPLIKAHAYGNDFLLAPSPIPAGLDLRAFSRRVCHRHEGIGADGLLIVQRRPAGAAMRLFNADGSPSELSGNGVRCLGAWLALSDGLTAGTRLAIDTGAGLKSLEVLSMDGPRVTMRAGMSAARIRTTKAAA